MGRTAIDLNKQLFDKLKNQAIIGVNSKVNDEILNTNYFVQSDAESKQWLINSKIDDYLIFNNNVKISKLTLGDEKIFVLIADEDYEAVNDEFTKIDDLFSKIEDFYKFEGGLLTLVISELDVEPRKDIGFEIIQILIPSESGNPVAINGLNLRSLFPKIQFFKVKPGSVYDSYSIQQLYLRILLSNKKNLKLKWSDDALGSFSDCLNSAHEHFPYHCLINSLQSHYWSNAFLEVYKPLEFIFSMPKIKDLKMKISSGTDLISLSKYVEESLGWRASEEQALEALFDVLSESQKDLIRNACQNLDESGSQQINSAKRIYKLRNSIVHLRPAITTKDIDGEQWCLIIKEMCKAAIDLYGKFFETFALAVGEAFNCSVCKNPIDTSHLAYQKRRLCNHCFEPVEST